MLPSAGAGSGKSAVASLAVNYLSYQEVHHTMSLSDRVIGEMTPREIAEYLGFAIARAQRKGLRVCKDTIERLAEIIRESYESELNREETKH